MRRVRERAGQRVLFCRPLDQHLFWQEVHPGAMRTFFNKDEFNEALDTHDFEAVLGDGEDVLMECLACGEEHWERGVDYAPDEVEHA